MANDDITSSPDLPSIVNNQQSIPDSVLAAVRQHPMYWFDDGSLIIRAQDDAFRVHGSLLNRHSPVLSSLPKLRSQEHAVPVVHLPVELGVLSRDLEVLLEHLYHDIPLASDTPFSRVASVLRVSSERQLHFPSINAIARQRIQNMFSKTLEDLNHPEAADDALDLAVEYNIYPIQKALYYSVATNLHLHEDETGVGAGAGLGDNTTTETSLTLARLSPAVSERCKTLLDQLISHFTPILFTVATAHHMECTDVFAEKWMPLVIGPALENNGLCKPIETLQTIIDLDWRGHGLCDDCVRDKREEWREEQKDVWDKMDVWLGLKRGE